MIHIVKQKGGYSVKSVADNGELLATSETLKTKQVAWKNVRAMIEEWETLQMCLNVQDDTLEKPVVMFVSFYKVQKTTQQPKPRYQPGKNPKKKK